MRTGTFYEINVSRHWVGKDANGKDEQKHGHVFATDSSIRNYDHFQVLDLLRLFAEKFPKSEGYEVSVTTWSCGCPKLHEDVTEFVKENWGHAMEAGRQGEVRTAAAGDSPEVPGTGNGG